ncbi:MAG: hypothetical protein IJQ59_02100 [Bacteroidaceae bacterium]|jgi:hypothetical protein|nr:hypothetical protein [Bacteroidaceae bacterium]
MPQQQTQEQALQERQKYVAAFNDTMIKIWKERITLLDVIDTKTLLHSPISLGYKADGKLVDVHLSQAFREYGLWQDYGTGRETPRGNPGDIGRPKVRQRRRWFSIKYYASFMNIKEFYADNLGKEFIGIINEALDDYNFRRYHGTMRA